MKRLLIVYYMLSSNLPAVDLFLYTCLVEKNMTECRAKYWYEGVKKCGGPAATKKKKVHEA